MPTMTSFECDGHTYHLHQINGYQTIVVDGDSMEQLGAVETSPCGEYFIVASYNNPLGMASHHHINSTTLEEAAKTIVVDHY